MACAAPLLTACDDPDRAMIEIEGPKSKILFAKDSVAEGRAKTYPLGAVAALDGKYVRLRTDDQPRPVLEVTEGAHERHWDRLRDDARALISGSPDSAVADNDLALYAYYTTKSLAGGQAAYPFTAFTLHEQPTIDTSFLSDVAYTDGTALRLYAHGACSATTRWSAFFPEVFEGLAEQIDQGVAEKGYLPHWGGMIGYPYLGLDSGGGQRPDGANDGFALAGQFSIDHWLAGRMWVAWTHGYQLSAHPGGQGAPSSVTVRNEPWGDTVGNAYCALGECSNLWEDLDASLRDSLPKAIAASINQRLTVDAFSLSFDVSSCGGEVPCKGPPIACTPADPGAKATCHSEWTKILGLTVRVGLGRSPDEARQWLHDFHVDDFQCMPTESEAGGKCVFHTPVEQVNTYADEFELVFRQPRDREFDHEAQKWFTPRSTVAVLAAIAAKYSPDDPVAHLCDLDRIGKKGHWRLFEFTRYMPGGIKP